MRRAVSARIEAGRKPVGFGVSLDGQFDETAHAIASLKRLAFAAARKLDTPGPAIDTAGLHGADVAGPSRALQSMRGGGTELSEATALSGWPIRNG